MMERQRCDGCACWKRINDSDFGHCLSADRLDGDMNKGPAGTSRKNDVCEAHVPAESDYRRDPINWPENIR